MMTTCHSVMLNVDHDTLRLFFKTRLW